MNRIFYVYAWFREDYGTPFYIGKGKNNRYLRLDNRKAHFMNIYNTVPTRVEILKDGLTEKEAFKLEMEIIHDLVFNQGYSIEVPEFKSPKIKGKHLVNLTWGGDGTTGYTYKQSEQTIANRVAKNTGKKRTPEQRENISKGIKKYLSNEKELERLKNLRKGFKTSEETKELLRQQKLGKKLSDEHKQRIKEGYQKIPKDKKIEINKRRKESTRLSKGHPIYCIELDMKFISISEAIDYFKEHFNEPLNRTQLKLHLDGKTKKDWYKEVYIDGILTKLHWKNC